MTQEQFSLLVKTTLGKRSHLYGETLYSSIKTIKKSPIYFIGANPGGADKCTIVEDLEKLSQKPDDYNEYIHGIWPNGANPNPLKGKEKLQKRVQKLFQEINVDLKEVCTSNLIFFTSRDLKELKKKMNMSFINIADICWPIHEEILENVKPKIIIALGTSTSDSTFSYFKKKFRISDDMIKNIPIGHGDYSAKYFNYENRYYIFLPHLSYFTIKNEEVFMWITNKINSGL